MRKICGWFVLILIVAAGSSVRSQVDTNETIRINTSLINIPVIVSDRDNRYVPGLTKSNFRVFQDGVEQSVEIFNNDSAPMNVILALDTSRSTAGVLGKIKKAARKFIKDLGPEDRCMIVTFDNDIEILSGLTSNKKDLESAIKNATIGAQFGTVLRDAVYDAVQRQLRGEKGRKALILLTDGADFGSSVSRSQLFDLLTESDTVVYPIFYESAMRVRDSFPRPFPDQAGMGRLGRRGGIGGRQRRFPSDNFPGRNPNRQNRRNLPGAGVNRPNSEIQQQLSIAFLEELSEKTGGRFFREQKADLGDAFQQIVDEMKRQYVLGFYPLSDSPAGTEHKIKVQVDRPGIVVRAKSRYRTQAQ